MTVAQRQSHQLVTQPPPVRGLNTTTAIALMAPTDAMEMDNFVSTELGVQLREGWREYATGLGAEVRTIMSYDGSPINSTNSPISQSVLFAATDNGIYEIEGGGAMTLLDRVVTLSGALYAGRFSFIQFTTEAGNFLIACSETDGGFYFNGVIWTKMTSGTGNQPGTVAGVDPAKFVQVCAYKRRLMFVERGKTTAWILPLGSVAGAADDFDFGPMLRSGGMLLALVNWTQDAGDGIDDRLVVLGSSGDLLIYEGEDPTDALKFSNVGTWYIGQPPIGRRCFTSSGGNVYVLTVFGVVPVSQIVQGGLDNLNTSSTEFFQQLRKIQTVLNADFSALVNVVGWEIMYFPTKAMLHIARPQQVSNLFIQYGFQEHNLAWSKLLDIPATTFGRRLTEMYAGTVDGRVLRVHDGNSDGMKINGSGAYEIRGRVTPAFNYFGDPGVLKQALMMRVNFLSLAKPAYVVSVNTNFAVRPPEASPSPGQFSGALWDQSFWDQNYWAGAVVSFGEWRSVEGMGYSLAPSIYVASEQPCTIANFEFMLRNGGPM